MTIEMSVWPELSIAIRQRVCEKRLNSSDCILSNGVKECHSQTMSGADDVSLCKNAGAAELTPCRTGILVADAALPWERVGSCLYPADDAVGRSHRRRNGWPTANLVIRHWL